MNLAYLWTVALIVMLFVGAKVYGPKKWNDDVMSLDQTKCFLGFCAIVIIFHHCAQKTIASWVNVYFQRPGLAPYVCAGYLAVAMFMFCSGYGLYVSAKAKKDFFKRFLPVRYIPILIPTLLTMLVYIGFMYMRHMRFQIDPPFESNPHSTWHPYIWFIPCILWMYLVFYLAFRFIKKDWISLTVLFLGAAGYMFFCYHFGYGSWWYNTVLLFFIGALYAKFQGGITKAFKKLYWLFLPLFLILTAGLFAIGNYSWNIIFKFKIMITDMEKLNNIIILAQCLSAIFFVFVCVLIGMKIKIGNPVLRFLGKYTLEIYLIHGIFVEMFSYYLMKEGIRPVYYIDNVALYVLVVLVLSIPVSFAVGLLDKKVGKLIRPKK